MTSSSPLPNADRNRIRLHHFIQEHFTVVPLIAPPATILEPALEYQREARFVAFYHSAPGDETRYDDGQYDEQGCAPGFAALCQHPSVQPFVHGINLGRRQVTATHSLVIDRTERRLYIAKRGIGIQFVNAQDRNDVVARAWTPDRYRAAAIPTGQLAMFSVDNDVHIVDLDARRQRVTDLVRWMDNWTRPPIRENP